MFCFVFLIDFTVRERKGVRGEERERERDIHQLPPVSALTGARTCHLGMCPDRELNPQRFGAPGNAPAKQATPARARLFFILLNQIKIISITGKI